MDRNEKKITVSRETRAKLVRIFGVTESMIWKSLAREGAKGSLANRIRKAALENGGVMLTAQHVGDAFHDADGTMRQHRPNGAVIEMSTADGSCRVWHRGELVQSYDNVRVREIPAIQAAADALE